MLLCVSGYVYSSSLSQQRKLEFRIMITALIKLVLGPEVDEMLEIQGLATAPSKQGRGYATALVKVINDMVCSIHKQYIPPALNVHVYDPF